MSTLANASNNNNPPKIHTRREIIILDESLDCHCGRTKGRVHCPSCGKAKTYGKSETVMANIPNSLDIIKDCKVYRCEACAEIFNDVDWYFNCHAPRKIDLVATKKLQEEKIKNYWMDRIQRMEKFDYNTRTKCMAQCGLDPWALQELFAQAKLSASRERKPKTREERIIILKDEIDNLQYYLKDHPQDMETIEDIEKAKQKLKILEDQS